MAIWYAHIAGNWDVADAWNSAVDGSGDHASHPLTVTDTADLNGLAMTLNVDPTIALIRASGAVGQLTVSGNRTVNGNITYAGTNAAGMVVAPTGTALVVNGQATETSSGPVIVPAGTANVTITNSGGTAITCAGANAAVSNGGSGTLLVTGKVVCSNASGRGIYHGSSSTNSGLVGDIEVTAGYGVRGAAGTFTVDGKMKKTGGGAPLYVSGGTIVWTGARTLAAATDCYLMLASGTLNLASLVLANSGRFVIDYFGGTLTIGSGGTLAQINNQSHAAQACILGIAADIVNGPTLPAANKVDSGEADYGYPASPLDPSLDLAALAAAAAAEMHAIDAAFLETNKDEIFEVDTAILAEFGVTGGLTAASIAAAAWAYASRTLTA
jgi:hypothetical protein